jgi:hypothetical protein
VDFLVNKFSISRATTSWQNVLNADEKSLGESLKELNIAPYKSAGSFSTFPRLCSQNQFCRSARKAVTPMPATVFQNSSRLPSICE